MSASSSSNDSLSVAHGRRSASSSSSSPDLTPPPPPKKEVLALPTPPPETKEDKGDPKMSLLERAFGTLGLLTSWFSSSSQNEEQPRQDDTRDNRGEDLVEERKEIGYTSTFEGNSRKRRRPTPSDDRDEDEKPPTFAQPKPSLGLPHAFDSVLSPISPRTIPLPREQPPSSDHSNHTSAVPSSSSERPSPSTNPTDRSNDALRRESIIEYAENKWKERSVTPVSGGFIKPAVAQSGSSQLQRSLARRKQGSTSNESSLFRISALSRDESRVNKRSSTPGSMRSSVRQRRTTSTPRRDSTHSYFPGMSQYSPPSQVPFGTQNNLRASTSSFASSFRASIFDKKKVSTPSRVDRLQDELERSRRRQRKPWQDQLDPDSKTYDPEGLALLIKQLQENQVEGFENYAQVQERQRLRDAQIRELRAKPKQEILRDIGEDSLNELHAFLTTKHADFEARRVGGCPITPRNLRTLSGSQWLNDEVINAYIYLIKERENVDGKPTMITMNSIFVTSLKDHGYSRVARWAKRAGAHGEKILSLKGVIIPIHRNYHWTLAFINVARKRFEYYDSLAGNWDPISLLRGWMKNEVGPKYIDSEWEDHYLGDETPQQGNGVDCGVFLCKTAEVICRGGIISFTQKDIPKIRRMMQVELFKGDLAAT